MSKPADKNADKPAAVTPSDESSDKPVDNGSDHRTSVSGTDADESGYRRDDYWRAEQGERELDAGAETLRERDRASTATPAPSSDGEPDPSGPSGPSDASSPADPTRDDDS